MSNTNTIEFNTSIYRIFFFLASFFRWILGVTVKDPPNVVVSPKNVYIERNKSRFLLTFQKKTNDQEICADWNSTIEPVIHDAERLKDILADANNALEKKWRSRVLMENTPRGNVIMYYDIYKRGFSYYCDNAVMPYDIINAVAMKYVMTFRCRDFFVDSNVLPPQKEKREDNTTAHQSTKIVEDKTAFVKFKTYNTATKKAGGLIEDDKTINCFLHLGCIRNWMPIPKKVNPNPINGFQTDMIPSNKKLSYLEYKKQMSSYASSQ